MNEEKPGKCLRQVEHICGNRYNVLFIYINKCGFEPRSGQTKCYKFDIR